MSKHRAQTLVVVLTLIGFAFRLYRIDAIPLRGDEAFSVMNWARQPLSVSLTETATIEPHPPLTYVLFRGWGLLAGTSEFSMRLLPAVSNLLGIPALYAIGKRVGGRKLGPLAALLWTIHPFEIWQAQDARNYAIWAGMSAGALWLGLRAVDKQRRGDWILYVLAATATIQIYYLELFTQMALALYVVISRWGHRRLIARWLAAQGLVVATAVVSFMMLQVQLFASNGYSGTAGQGLDVPQLFTWLIPTLMFGETLPKDFISIAWPWILALLLAGLALAGLRNRDTALLFALLGFVPLALIAVVSVKLDVFRPHYILSAVPGYILMVSVLLVEVSRRLKADSVRRYAPYALAAVWLGASVFSLFGYYFNPDYTKAKDWPALAAYLHSHVEPDDLVIQASADAAFGFYFDKRADDMALPASPEQSREEIIQILNQSSRQYSSIWLIGQTFPDWPNVGVVEAWMNDTIQRVRSTQIAGLRVEQYMPWIISENEYADMSLATFGNITELANVEVFPMPEPTGELTVWTYWRVLQPSDTSFKVFVHLIGAVNPATGTPLWAQDDQYPQDGRISTVDWTAGTIYRDVYSIPITNVPAGDYSLEFGFYDPESGGRLPVNGGDSYVIPSIHLP